MKPLYRFLCTSAMVLAAGTSALAADETYPIRLNRAFKPGDTYHTHVVTNYDENMIYQYIASPQRTQNATVKSDIEGRVDITAVDDKGNEKDLTLTVESFLINGKESLSRGDIIDVKRTDKDVTFAARNGVELSPDTKHVLGQVYDKLNTSGVTDDDVMGSRTPRKVGDTWKIDVDAATKQAAGSGVTFEPNGLDGTSTVKGTQTLEGEKMVRLDTELSIKNLKPNLPPTIKFERSQTDEHFSNVIPIDPKALSIQSHATIDIDMFLNPMGAVSGGPVDVERKTHLDQTITNTPVKK